MYSVYVIYNKNYDKIYIGQTADVKERIRIHNSGEIKGYTSKFDGEWRLIYQEFVPDRRAALLREKQLKSYRGRVFVKQYIPR